MIFGKLKKIKPRPMISHLVVTLVYPAVRAFLEPERRLLAFTNAVTVVGLILVVVGIIYSMNLHGDFDVSRYYLQRGLRSSRFYAPRSDDASEIYRDPSEFLTNLREKRADAFNYPLFLGIIYVLASVVVVYGFLERNV